MNKDAIQGLQRLDCNCNDCGFLQRNLPRYNRVLAEDFDNQYFFFRLKKARRLRAARKKILTDPERGKAALDAALALTFSYLQQRAPIQYGHCQKFKKEITFIPNTFQLETQECFVHRKDFIAV